MSLVTEGARAPQRLYEFAPAHPRAVRQDRHSARGRGGVALAADPAGARLRTTRRRAVAAAAARALGDPERRDRDVPAPRPGCSSGWWRSSWSRRRCRSASWASRSCCSTGYGLTGVGVAWLVAQSVIAIGLLATELRAVWLPRVPFHRLPHRTPDPSATWPARRRAVLAAVPGLGAGRHRCGPTPTSVRSWSAARGADGRSSVHALRPHRPGRAQPAAPSRRRSTRWTPAATAMAGRCWRPGARRRDAAGRPWMVETHIRGAGRAARGGRRSGTSSWQHARPRRSAPLHTDERGRDDGRRARACGSGWTSRSRSCGRPPAPRCGPARTTPRSTGSAPSCARSSPGACSPPASVHGDFWLGNVLDHRRRHDHRHRRLGACRHARASPPSTS